MITARGAFSVLLMGAAFAVAIWGAATANIAMILSAIALGGVGGWYYGPIFWGDKPWRHPDADTSGKDRDRSREDQNPTPKGES